MQLVASENCLFSLPYHNLPYPTLLYIKSVWRWQVVMLRQHRASGRLVVLVQALTAARLAAADPSAAAAVPAPLQARPQEP